METKSDEKLKRITDLLWKIWWFSLYLLIIPSIALLICYLVASYLSQDYLFSIFLSIIFLIFCQIFFYKIYDKYRNNPFFKNHRNNLLSRINISFLIPIFSLGVSLIPLIINSNDLYFQLFPLLYYTIISLNIFFYIRSKPIEGFDLETKEFFSHRLEEESFETPKVRYCSKCGELIKGDHYFCPNCGNKIRRKELEAKQLQDKHSEKKHYKALKLKKSHNLVILLTYFISSVSLLLSLPFASISVVILFVIYVSLYFYSIFNTRSQRSYFTQENLEKDIVEKKLLNYKKTFLMSFESVIFCLIFMISNIYSILIQLNIIKVMLIIITLNIILFFSYLKLRIISVLYYAKEFNVKEIKYKKSNGIFSIIIYSLIFLLIFLLQDLMITIFGVVSIVGLFCISYLEQKNNYIGKSFIRFLYLTLASVIFGLISFRIIPIFLSFFTLNFQIMTFLILFYFSLEIFKYYNVFTKEKVILIQNLISVVLFFLIAYSIYPFLLIQGNLLFNIYIGLLIFFLSLLLSFYRLYNRFFKESAKKLFAKIILMNFAIIDLFIIFLIDEFLLSAFITSTNLFIILIFSIILFLILLSSFIELNSRFEIIENAFEYYFYFIWILIPLIFTLILYLSYLNTFSIIFGLHIFLMALFADIILLCFTLQYQFRFGLKLGKISSKSCKIIINLNAYVISFSSASIIFLLTSLIPILDYFTIFFLSLLTFTLILNLSSISESFTSNKARLVINSLFLFYLSIIVAHLFFLISKESSYFIHLPLISFTSLLNILLIYLRAKHVIQKAIRIALWINNIFLSSLLFSIPYIVAFDLLTLGFEVNFITTLNFSLLILFFEIIIYYLIIRKINPTSQLLTRLLQSEVLIVIILMGTTIFYYSIIFIPGLLMGLLIPLILTSGFFYLPLLFSQKKGLFNKKLIEFLILLNTLFLGGCILSIPSVFGLELIKLGFEVSFLYIFISTLLILFLLGKTITYLADKIMIPKFLHSFVNLELIINWSLISIFITYAIYEEITILFLIKPDILAWNLFIIPLLILIFFFIHLYNIILIRNLKTYFSEDLGRESLSYIIDTFLSYFVFITFYGIISSISFILAFNVVYFNILAFLPNILEIFNFILFFILFWSLLNPLMFRIFKNIEIKGSIQRKLNQISIILVVLVSIVIFIELYWAIYLLGAVSLIYPISIFIFSIILIGVDLYQNIELFTEEYDFFKRFYLTFLRILSIYFCILYIEPILTIPFIIILDIIFVIQRPRKLAIRWILYSILSIIGFIKMYLFFEKLDILQLIIKLPFGLNIILYLVNFVAVLGFSIIFNLREKNLQEKFTFYSTFSLLTFIFLMSFTNILLIYAITISIFLFLMFFGIDYYTRGDYKYKLFLKPCLVIFVFNLVSWISYMFLFTVPALSFYNNILTFSLTLIFTAFTIIILYNDVVEPLRKILIIFSCFSLTVFIPTFIFIFFISYLQFSFTDPLLVIISLNIAFVLFYISLSIYFWEISWRIWKTGWYLWLIIPIVNFYLINKLILGIDIYTNAVSFLGMFDLTGSFIITLILSTLFYIPVFYSKLKKYFYEIIIIIWAESLSLTYWISQNLFSNNFFLSNLFFGFLSVLLIVPILWKLKKWKIISLFWFLLCALNCGFLSYFLYLLNFLLELIISINIIIISVFIIIFSLFPNLKEKSSRILLIFSYFLTLIGVFLLLFFILYNIFLHPIISMNISFIIISGALFTSKYIKVNKIYTHFAISLIFIINISSIVFFTFNILPNMTLFSMCFAISTFFGSLLLFNHFDMIIKRFDYRYIWLPFGFSLSLSFTILLSLFIPSFIFFLVGFFILINTIFIQRILYKFKPAIIFLYPVSLSFFLLEAFMFFSFLINYLALIWVLSYITLYQIFLNVSTYITENAEKDIKSFYQVFFKNKKNIILINILSFFLEALLFSLLVSNLSFVFIIYQLIEFWLIFSVLSLLILYYTHHNNKLINFEHIEIIIDIAGGFFYTIIPIFSAISAVLISLSITLDITNIIFIFFFTFSSVMFLEILMDKLFFNFLLLKKESYYSHTNILYLLGYLIYLEIDVVFFLFIINYLGIFESILILLLPLIPLFIVDIFNVKFLGQRIDYLALTILSFLCSTVGLLLLIFYTPPLTILIKLYALVFICSLFITNRLYLKYKTVIFQKNYKEGRMEELKEQSYQKYYNIRQNLIGISFYISLIFLIQDAASFLIPVEISIFYMFLISALLFILSEFDKYTFKFLGPISEYISTGSWFSLVITSNMFLIYLYISFIPELFFTAFPLLIFLISTELIYLFKLLTFWTFFESYFSKILKVLIIIIYLNFVSIPLYFLTLTYILIDFNLILLSFIIIIIISELDEFIGTRIISNRNWKKLVSYTTFIIINMISIDVFLFLEILIKPIIPLFTITINLNISLLTLLIFYALFFNTLNHHSLLAFISWASIFITFSLLIFQITLFFNFFPIIFTSTSFSIALILYPFIYLMEKIRNLFNFILDRITSYFRKINALISNIFNYIKNQIISLKNLIKRIILEYWVYLLAIICAILGIYLSFLLLFTLQLAFFNSILIGAGVALFIMFSVYSYKSSIEDPNKALKYRMLYLSSIWTAVLGIIFNFLDIEFYILALFLSLVILGAILLPYIYYLEKQKGISIRWRFYLTLTFILIIIITLLLFYFQIITEIF
ncbi:MAG: zinc ribbon domain-containing protein [Promethearchaeota archaeon]|nr:MAG: zinc ribbon domain-containing protein [Candidatus Lokiarchaeota archaeon]